MRKAASMLELIVAIVIMGIAMMTLPLILTQVEQNNNFAMQQEAILMAKTQLGDILTYRWDDKSMDASYNFGVLDTTAGDNSLNRFPDNNSTRRVGHIRGNKRRKFFDAPTFASTTLGIEGTIYDDIDDFNNQTKLLINSADTNKTLGYKLSGSTMKVTVKYISDATDYTKQTITFDFNQTSNPGGTTNIKMVQVDLNNTELDNTLTLRAFSSNIGVNMLLRRDF